MSRLFKLLLLVALAFGALTSFAQDSPPVDTTYSDGALTALGNIMNPPPVPAPDAAPDVSGWDVWQAIADSLVSIFQGADFTNSGMHVLYALVLIRIGVTGMKFAGGLVDGAGVIADFIKLMMVSSLAWVAMAPAPWAAPLMNGQTTLGDFAYDAFVTRLAGVNGSNWLGTSISTWLKVIGAATNISVVPPHLTWLQTLAYLVEHWPMFGLCLVLQACAVLAMVVAAVYVVGQLIVGLITIKLAIYLAPLVVPWVLFKPLSFLFDAWVKMLINGGMAALLGSLFMNGGAAMIARLQTYITHFAANTNEHYWAQWELAMAYLALLFGAALYVFIAMKLGDFARSVVAGSAVGGIGGEMLGGAIGGAIGATKGVQGLMHQGAALQRGLEGMREAAGDRAAKTGAIAGNNARGGVVKGEPISAMSMGQQFEAFRAGRSAYLQGVHRGNGRTGAKYAAYGEAGRWKAAVADPAKGPPPGTPGSAPATGSGPAPTSGGSSAAASGATSVPTGASAASTGHAPGIPALPSWALGAGGQQHASGASSSPPGIQPLPFDLSPSEEPLAEPFPRPPGIGRTPLDD